MALGSAGGAPGQRCEGNDPAHGVGCLSWGDLLAQLAPGPVLFHAELCCPQSPIQRGEVPISAAESPCFVPWTRECGLSGKTSSWVKVPFSQGFLLRLLPAKSSLTVCHVGHLQTAAVAPRGPSRGLVWGSGSVPPQP